MTPSEVKALCNLKHAAGRALERYGVRLSLEDVAHAGRRIRRGCHTAVPLRPDRRHPDRRYYFVLVKGAWLPVVFDERTGTVVTVLPQCVRDEYLHVIPAPAEKTTEEAPPEPPAEAAPAEAPVEPPPPPEPAASAEERAAALLAQVPDAPDPDLSWDYHEFGELSRRLSARVLGIAALCRRKGVTAGEYELLVAALRDAARRRDEASLAAEYAFGVPAL